MTQLNSDAQAILDNHMSHRSQVFMNGDDYCFNHDGSYYKVISANDRNIAKLEVIRTHNLPLTVKLEEYEVDTFQCVLFVQRLDKEFGFHQDNSVVCMVSFYRTRAEVDKRLDDYINAITETISSVNDGKDYHEIHPDGSIARGVFSGIAYQEVIENNKVTYKVYHRNGVIAMEYPNLSEPCIVFVDIGANGGDGAVLTEQSENIDLFHTALLDDSDDYYRDWRPQDAIVDKAFSEHGCPRWGMSW